MVDPLYAFFGIQAKPNSIDRPQTAQPVGRQQQSRVPGMPQPEFQVDPPRIDKNKLASERGGPGVAAPRPPPASSSQGDVRSGVSPGSPVMKPLVQAAGSSPGLRAPQYPEVECPICAELKLFDPDKWVECDRRCTFCSDCLVEMVRTAVANQKGTIKCPCHPDEHGPVSDGELARVLPPDLFRQREQALARELCAIVNLDVVICDRCRTPISDVAKNANVIICPGCRVRICGFCHEVHDGICGPRRVAEEAWTRAANALQIATNNEDEANLRAQMAADEACARQLAAEEAQEAQEAEREAALREAEEARRAAAEAEEARQRAQEDRERLGRIAAMDAAQVAKLPQCPHCEIATEKTGGCNHMTCPRCGKHWCWLCRAKLWKPDSGMAQEADWIAMGDHYDMPGSPCFNRHYV